MFTSLVSWLQHIGCRSFIKIYMYVSIGDSGNGHPNFLQCCCIKAPTSVIVLHIAPYKRDSFSPCYGYLYQLHVLKLNVIV